MKLCQRCNEPLPEDLPCEVHGLKIFTARYCDPCIEVLRREHEEAESGKPAVITLGKDWPKRHKDAIAMRHGKALERAGELWASMVSKGNGAMILYGNRGTGKSWMATYWAFLRAQGGQEPGLYRTAYELFLDLRQAWRPQSQQSEHDVMAVYKKTPYLVLDQMHQCRAIVSGDGNDRAAMWEKMALADLLDYRYHESKMTVLIVTVPTQADMEACFDADIVSRVGEAGGCVECNWDSYR